MKKEKIIKTHTRRTKSGKTVTVRQHRAKYDAAEEAKQLAKKIGAGKELETLKKKPKKEDVLSNEVLGVDLSKMSNEDFKEFASGFMDENDKPAPKTRGAFKKWVENQNWGSEGAANFREGVAEYMKNGGAKGIVSSGKDPITESMRKKGKEHYDNIQKSSDQRNSIERPPKTATKPTGVKSPGKTSTPVHGVSAEEFKAWYHWDAAGDPKNKTALAVEKKLRAKMGRSEYSKYFDEMTNSYSSRGHLKAYKALEPETAKAIKGNKMVAGTAEAQKEVAKLQGAKKAEKIFAAKEKEAKGNLNKLSGKGTNPNEKVSPKVVGWEKKNGTEVAKYNTEEKKSGKGTESKYGRSTDSLIKRKAAERHKLSYDKNGYYVDKNGQTYGILGNGYVIKRKYKYTTPNSYFHPDKVSKQVKFKAKEGNNYKMPDGSILTYIGRNVGKGRKGEHRFKDFKTGKIKFKDSDTIYALSEQKKGIPDTNKPRRGPRPPARDMEDKL